MDPRASRTLGLTARLNGGQALSLSETAWDVSGKCENSRRVSVESRDYREFRYDPFWKVYTRDGWFRGDYWAVEVPGIGHAHTTHLEVRCGKCAPCRYARRRLWSIRARTECERSTRTWFITLTANPTNQLRWSSEAAARLRTGGTNPTTLSEDEFYAERCKEAGRDLTKFMKRVRKRSGEGLRAMWVFEKHEGGGAHNGLPHIHGLLHESASVTLNYRILRSEWGLGFATAKLLTNSPESPDKVGAYISKCCGYLTKATSVRIRASRYYGEPLNALAQRKRPQGIALPQAEREAQQLLPSNEKNGLIPNNDAGIDLRARARSAGECKAPAVGESAERGGESLLSLQLAMSQLRPTVGRRKASNAPAEGQKGATTQLPEGDPENASRYAKATKGE